MKFIFLILISTQSVWSQIDLVGIRLPYRLTVEKDTPYQKMINKMQSNSKLPLKINVRPVARSSLSFFSKKNLCILPTSITAMKLFYPEKMEKLDVIESKPIENVIVTIFSKGGTSPIKSLNDLNGKVVATWNGISTKKLLPNGGFKTIQINQDQQSLNLLATGRVDYIIGFLPDTPLVAERSGLNLPLYNKDIILLKTPVSILCHKTPETKNFITDFNTYLKELKASGELQKMLGKHSVIAK